MASESISIAFLLILRDLLVRHSQMNYHTPLSLNASISMLRLFMNRLIWARSKGFIRQYLKIIITYYRRIWS